MEDLKKIALVFPGQGSQVVGMGRSLHDMFPCAQEILEKADEALGDPNMLGSSLSTLMFEGPLELLSETQHAQPALFTTSMMALCALQSQDSSLLERITVVAGHSLGEYSALSAAGVLGFEETLKLLQIRGKAMQEAVPQGKGAMAALLSLSLEQLDQMPQNQDEICVIANDNSLGQVVVSGHKNAVEQAVVWAKSVGGKGVMLNVSGPFHSPLMSAAEDVMVSALEKIKFCSASIPVISNISAELQSDSAVLKKHLVQQMTGRVRWRETMNKMHDIGVTHVVEVGQGKVLSGLFKRAFPDIQTFPLSSPDDISLFLEHLHKGNAHV